MSFHALASLSIPPRIVRFRWRVGWREEGGGRREEGGGRREEEEGRGRGEEGVVEVVKVVEGEEREQV